MTFGSKIDNSINSIFPCQFLNKSRIANIPLHKYMVGMVLVLPQILQIARIGQLVQIHDPHIRMFLQHHPDKITADETSAARNQNCPHNCSRKSFNGSCHGLIARPSKDSSLRQSNRLLRGLFAAEGNSSLLHGSIGTRSPFTSHTKRAIS